MPTHDWHALQPSRPLEIDDPRYVKRLEGAVTPLADMVRHGLTPIVVTGAVGGGKTTEMRRALSLVKDEMFAKEVRSSDLVKEDGLNAGQFLFELSRHLLDEFIQDNPYERPSRGVVNDIRASDPHLPRGGGVFRQPAELAKIVIEEISGIAGKSRVALFIDGLDGVDPARARDVVLGLLELQHIAELIIAVPPALVYGPDSHDVLAHNRVWWIPTVAIDKKKGRQFLARVAARRLGHSRVPRILASLNDQAATASGGVTRLYLLLMHDAAMFALAAGKKRPTEQTLTRAIRDRMDSLIRLLLSGDRQVLAQSDGVDGLEVPADRKVRLLSQNLLLEYSVGFERIVRPHPLLRVLLARSS